jgi:hypothetical protein
VRSPDRARRGVGEPCTDRDRARRSGRRHLNDTETLTEGGVDVEVEADLPCRRSWRDPRPKRGSARVRACNPRCSLLRGPFGVMSLNTSPQASGTGEGRARPRRLLVSMQVVPHHVPDHSCRDRPVRKICGPHRAKNADESFIGAQDLLQLILVSHKLNLPRGSPGRGRRQRNETTAGAMGLPFFLGA